MLTLIAAFVKALLGAIPLTAVVAFIAVGRGINTTDPAAITGRLALAYFLMVSLIVVIQGMIYVSNRVFRR